MGFFNGLEDTNLSVMNHSPINSAIWYHLMSYKILNIVLQKIQELTVTYILVFKNHEE